MENRFLRQAIEIAVDNASKGDGPFGAVIIKDGEIIAAAGNRVTQSNDPTAHAEVLAIREAARKLGTWDLSGCELFSSCEPCPMCLGAVYWARLSKVCYACSHVDAKEAGFDDSHIYHELRKEPGERGLEMKQLMREEGLQAFREWKRNPDKKEY